MGRRRTLRIDAELASLRQPRVFHAAPGMLVDAGFESTWIPRALLEDAGVRRAKELAFRKANGEIVERSVGFAILRAGGFETVDEVVFGEPGDVALLGARTLLGFGARIDARAKRLVPCGPHPAAVALVSAGA